MSEVITLTGGATETIHGTYTASITYIAMLYGDAPDAWSALSVDNRKRTLATAVRYLNAQTWATACDTFAERDAIPAFASAQYELAVLIAADPGVVATADQGSNIASLGAGSASVTYFSPTTKNAATLPPVVQRLVGGYLAAATLAGADGGASHDSGGAANPFSACEDDHRHEPY